jgi:hypothetical protein
MLKFVPARRVSSFTTCFVNTPLQRNLIPLFINPRITISPSWPIIITCFISMTSLRPCRSAPALSQALLSSAAHGAMSFPRPPTDAAWRYQSTRSSALLLPTRNEASRAPKPLSPMSLNFQERCAETRRIKVEDVEMVRTVGSYKREVDLRSAWRTLRVKHTP